MHIYSSPGVSYTTRHPLTFKFSLKYSYWRNIVVGGHRSSIHHLVAARVTTFKSQWKCYICVCASFFFFIYSTCEPTYFSIFICSDHKYTKLVTGRMHVNNFRGRLLRLYFRSRKSKTDLEGAPRVVRFAPLFSAATQPIVLPVAHSTDGGHTSGLDS